MGQVSLDADTVLSGTLHVYVAFDWGDEIDLRKAQQIVPAEVQGLARRPRTPPSMAFRPPPLRYRLGSVPLSLPEVGVVRAEADATLFDFAAISTSLRIPFHLTMTQLSHLAGWLAEPAEIVQAARSALAPLHQQLLPSIRKPDWKADLGEEYLVFELPSGSALLPRYLLEHHATWLANLLLLEDQPLSDDEVGDAVRLRTSYTPEDLLLADWGAAILVDRNCEETLQVIEFSNLQLLEYRYLDNRLDDVLSHAYKQISPRTQSWLPFWRIYSRPLRELGELRVEANEVFDRTANVLKLVGDQYLARVYRQLADRFHLGQWEQNIHRKLETVESIYQILSDQAATARAELLEIIIILLIAIEIGMTLLGRP